MTHAAASPPSQRDPQPLEILDHFCFLIDAERLFDVADPAHFQRLRKAILEALVKLLIWQRPFLQSTRGLQWPYEALKERVSYFEELACKADRAFVRQQAQRFLALLPFPQQWRWLMKAESDLGKDAEISAFIELENQRIQAKLKKKTQKQYKLRHFCQILKRPRPPAEKGVLRIFSIPYFFVAPELLKALSRRYFLYIEPPWGVVFRHTWLRPFAALEDPCLFGMACEEDAAFLRSQPGILTTPLAHGDFLENDVELDPREKKDFDVVFNATYDDMPRKRHARMLELLEHPLLRHVTVLFLGRGQTAKVEAFRSRIHRKGLGDRATVIANILRKDVPQQLARCRMGVHLALHENACRSVYEYFRADLPCVMSSATAGVNPELFNSQTGMMVPDEDLPERILDVLHHGERFTPRKWFLAHSGSFHSTRKLNRQLKAIFQNLGHAWHTDIIPLGSSGASRYLSSSDYEQFRPELEELLNIFRRYQRQDLSLRLAVD